MRWNAWDRYEREESDALHPRLRRLARESRAKNYGVKLVNSVF
jgi:hypothetical protein